ncbi:uncharacterized protein LOC129840453 [Salvelinus fontinalis]|uniref:uncharacterized protein LOC129840453 n=1 Tax=Salvelinus fontinalis TaxID=8038 RepID=UPI00248533D1|nr:uncharacterized protein LOC129840453 [Salvelinus fontinalis]
MCGRLAFKLSLLLLVWGVCTAFQEIQVKTLERGEDLGTLTCQNQTYHNMTYVICKIDRVISGGNECQVSLRFDQNGTNSTCDPRVTLQIESDRVFLHITNIQPSDEGDYTCQCAYNGGHHELHVHIYVNRSHEDMDNRHSNIEIIVGLAAAVPVTAFAVVIMRKMRFNRRTQKEAVYTFKEEEQQDIEPYNTFTRRDNGLYSTLQLPHSNP